MKPLVIGIAGKSGSGKTTLAQELVNSYNNDITIIRLDDYYKSQDHLDVVQRTLTNYDHPDAFDWDLLSNDLALLIEGKSINKPIYDYVTHTRSKEYEIVTPTKVIIIEGIFVLLEEKLRNLLDVKIYVDTDSDECIIRRITRDMNERGRDLDSIIKQYLECVKPMAEQFIEPTKKYADVIIPHGINEIALNVLKNQIDVFIKE